MTPSEAINAALDLLPDCMRSAQAIAILLAIQLQEAPNQEQKQIGGLPYMSAWHISKGNTWKNA